MPPDPTPVPTGPEFIIDAVVARFHYNPAATALVGGGFVVVRDTFSSATSSNKTQYRKNYISSDVYAQFYAADGTPTGGEFRVNDRLAGYQGSPRVAALTDGGFAVTWESTDTDERHPVDVYVRRFAADGAPVGHEFRVDGAPGGRHEAPEVAALADGGFVVAWAQTYGLGIGGVYVQRYGADGAPASGAVRADVYPGGYYGFPDITALAGGGFVAAWRQYGLDGTDVHARLFGADGMPAGEGFRVHVSDVGDQGDAAVVALADGGFVVAWSSDVEHYVITDVDATDIFAQRFTADGVPLGGEFRVHDATDGYQGHPRAWVLADGRLAVAWSGPEGSTARFFEVPGLSGPPAMPIKADVVARVVSQGEGDAGTAAFTFDVILDAAPSVPQSLRWHVEGSGANRANPLDFDLDPSPLAYSTLTFAAGETRKTITVLAAGDEEVEPDEGFAVWLSDPTPGLVLATPSAAATIVNDDMPSDPTPVPTGPEFSVRTTPADYNAGHGWAGDRQITGLADGGFMVVWSTGYEQGPSRVVAQRYTASGDVVGGEFPVHETIAGRGGLPTVAALADGGFVVTWAGQGSTEGAPLGVYARHFSASGDAVDGELLVAARAAASFNVGYPSVAALPDGGFVVTWERNDWADGGPNDVLGQRYTASGEAVGGEFQVNTAFTSFQSVPSISALADGGFVVTWGTFGQESGDFDIFARRFSASGDAAGGQFRVNATTAYDQRDPSVAALADGGFVVTWSGPAPEGGSPGIFGQRFSASGAAVGGEFRVEATTDGQSYPSVTALADGGFVVTWQSGGIYGDIFGQRFSAAGAPAGGEFRVSATPGSSESDPFVAALADGGFVVAWEVINRGAKPADTTFDIHAQRFAVDRPAGTVEIVANTPARSEGDDGVGAAFTVDVTLDTASPASRSVHWQVEGRGARPADAADFAGGVLPSGELVFAAGETRKTITVHVAGDAVLERDEGFSVSLLSPSDSLVVGAGGAAAATILDDDMPASAPPAHAAQVMRLYDAALDRSPERAGFEFWVGALGTGEALSSLAAGFLASSEFAARFGASSADDGAFVDRLYQNVLGRAGEAEGRAFWDAALGDGCTRAEVLAAFSESAEHVALTAPVFGDGFDLAFA